MVCFGRAISSRMQTKMFSLILSKVLSNFAKIPSQIQNRAFYEFCKLLRHFTEYAKSPFTEAFTCP